METFGEIVPKLSFLYQYEKFDNALYFNKKQKTDAEFAKQVLPKIAEKFAAVQQWDNETLYNALLETAQENGWKNGQVLWPARIALSGLEATPGGASEIASLLGKEETLRRLAVATENLQ